MKQPGLLGMLGAVVVAAASIGCTGGDGVSCEFVECGGDPTGNWQVEEVCGDFSALTTELEENCAGLEVTYGFDASGSISFNGNNTYDAVFDIEVNIVASFPAACIAGQAGSCADLTEGFDGEASCTGDVSDHCDCQFVDLENTTEQGTWEVNGEILLLDDSDEPGQTRFCQDGDTLRLETIADEAEDPTIIYVLSRN